MDTNLETRTEIRKWARTMVREFGFFRTYYESTPATYGETHALLELLRFAELEVSELGRLLNVEKSSASKLLANMRKKGWVKDKKTGDGRKKLFRLSEAGKKMAAEIEQLADQRMSLALEELDKAEQTATLEGLKHLSNALKFSQARKEFTIRVCQPADNAQMATIVRRAIKDLGFDGPGTAAADSTLDYLSSFNSERQCYLVAEKNKKIFGGAGVVRIPGEADDVCELVRMFLRPEARSSGIAQLLLDEVLRRAKKFGYRTCYLETTERMKAAQALYLRNGFRYVKKRRGNTGHFACNVLMEKSL